MPKNVAVSKRPSRPRRTRAMTCCMTASQRLNRAAEDAARVLDDSALEALALMIELHIEYKRQKGESVQQAIDSEFRSKQ